MKIFNKEISDFYIYTFIFVIIIFTKKNFGVIEFPFLLVLFFGILFFKLTYSNIEDKAKNETKRIIGDKLNNSCLIDYHLKYHNFFVFSEGGYRHDLLPENKGNEGIIIVHKDFFQIIDNNIYILGDCLFKESLTLDYQLHREIYNFFGYIPKYVKFYKPQKKYYETIIKENDKIIKTYISDLISINSNLSSENQNLRETQKRLIGDTGQVVNFGVATTQSVRKAFKKDFKNLEK